MTQEQDAFYQKLIAEHFSVIYRYIAGMVRDQKLAEELAYDTFHEAVEQIDELMTHEAPKLWLFRTAKNKTLSSFAQRERAARRNISLDYEDFREPVECVDGGINARTLETAIRQVLSEEDVELFFLYSQGAQFNELAAHLGCSVWACRKRMQRIRDKLKKELF